MAKIRICDICGKEMTNDYYKMEHRFLLFRNTDAHYEFLEFCPECMNVIQRIRKNEKSKN